MRIPEPPSFSNFYFLTIIFFCIVHDMQVAIVSRTLTTFTYLTMSTLYFAWRTAYQQYLIHLVQDSTLYIVKLNIYILAVEAKNARLSAKITEVDARNTAAGFAMLELRIKILVLEVQTTELRGATVELEIKTVKLEARVEELEARVEELEARAEELEGESERLRVLVVGLYVMAAELRATVDAGRRRTEVRAEMEALRCRGFWVVGRRKWKER